MLNDATFLAFCPKLLRFIWLYHLFFVPLHTITNTHNLWKKTKNLRPAL